MSFVIKLQYSNSPEIQLTKTVTDESTLTGTLRDGSSVDNPKVLIESSSLPVNINYATIDAFGRSYFITKITNVRNNIWEIELESDVLSSFASQIRANTAIIGKNENSFNLYLNDSRYRCYQNPHVFTKKFASGFNPANFSYVIALCASAELVQ